MNRKGVFKVSYRTILENGFTGGDFVNRTFLIDRFFISSSPARLTSFWAAGHSLYHASAHRHQFLAKTAYIPAE